MQVKKVSVCLIVSFLMGISGIEASWNNTEDAVRNAIVKIFVAEKKINWFYPYNVSSGGCTGTGFFINEQGDIVTCSHVVANASVVFIVIPSLGKQKFKAHVVGFCPQEDMALLRLTEESLEALRVQGNGIDYLSFGDSSLLKKGEEVAVLGYPGTLESDLLKTTVGVMSFNNGSLLQVDAAMNPGNSGGPLLNEKYEVVGVCKSVDRGGINQGIGFAVPINIVTMLLPYLYEHTILSMDDFGIVVTNAINSEIKEYFNFPYQGGCFICDVAPDKQAYVVGLQADDIIYAANDLLIDDFGEFISPFNGERIHFFDYMNQLPVNTEINLSVYRNGESLKYTLVRKLRQDDDDIPCKYPAYEDIEFEVFGGLIIMPLTVNYINQCAQERPGLKRYLTSLYNDGPRLVVANVIAGSQVAQLNIISFADTINEVNGEKVRTLDDFRRALLKSIETGFVVLKTTDERALTTNNVMTVLSLYDSCRETEELAYVHRYPLSDIVIDLIKKVDGSHL